MTEKACSFCQPKVTEFKHFERYGKDRIDLAVLWKSDNVIVKPDLLPASPDGFHFLMIPKPHKLAFAQNPDLESEVGHLLYRIEQEMGEPLVFAEHGGGSPELGYGETKNMSVYHQHAHLFPARGDILSYMSDALIQREGLNHKWWIDNDANPISEIAKLYNGHPYLYFQVGNRGLWIEDSGDTMPSQVTQRNMSRYFGQEVNWKRIREDDEMAKLSVERIVSALELCKHPDAHSATRTY